MESLIKAKLKRQCWPRRQRGAVIVLVVLALLSILLMATLALDGGHMLLNKTRLQSAVDAAALSGAKTLSKALDDPDTYLAAESAALMTLGLNTDPEGGNGELGDAIAAAGGVRSFARVEFSESVYGPFLNPPAVGVGVRYVRVTVEDYPLTGFLWGMLQAINNTTRKAVAAVATAGPSPSAAPCDLSPLVVCGVEDEDSYYGYKLGDLEVLKTAANDESLANGNYQLLDFGNGAKTVGELLAGGGYSCPEIGRTVGTKPGNTVGQAIAGMNVRLGEYQGDYKEGEYSTDFVIDYPVVGSGKGNGNEVPALSLNDSGVVVYGADKAKKVPGFVVEEDEGDLYYMDPVSGRVDFFDYHDWKHLSDACVLDKSGSSCEPEGEFERRILKIVVGDCDGLKGGATQVPVLGFGCFYIVQPGINEGGDAQIFGQFVRECEGDGVAGPIPVNDQGPLIIQLYKSYVDGVESPSKDS